MIAVTAGLARILITGDRALRGGEEQLAQLLKQHEQRNSMAMYMLKFCSGQTIGSSR